MEPEQAMINLSRLKLPRFVPKIAVIAQLLCPAGNALVVLLASKQIETIVSQPIYNQT